MEAEAEALYVYSPTLRNFGSFVRITALVLKAVKIFKLNLITSRAKSNIECQYDVQSLSVAAPEFSLLSSSYSLMMPKFNPSGVYEHMVRWKGKFVPCKSHYHSSRLKIRDTQLRDG